MYYPGGDQLTAPPSNTPPEKKCALGGHITNAVSGEPLKKVNIRLIAHGSGQGNTMRRFGSVSSQGYSATSEADGSFHIEGIEPGQYNLSANKIGFLTFNYGAKGPMEMGTILNLSPAQKLTNLTLGLSPQAVISGKVVDSDGDPVGNGMVQALAQSWMHGKQQYLPRGGGQINDLGEYRIANLSPGKYYICTQMYSGSRMGGPEPIPAPGKPDVRPVRTFYPSATTLANSTLIEVKAGQDASGTNIQIQEAQTYHVRGKVAGALPTDGAERTSLNLTPRDEGMRFFFDGQSRVKPDGTFDIPGVAPGSYTLNLFRIAGQLRTVAHQDVDVGASDVNGVELAMSVSGSLHGRVKIEGAPSTGVPQVDLAHLHLYLLPVEQIMMGAPPPAKFEPDGTFSIENVLPEKYTIGTNPPQGTYLASVVYGSSDILGKALDLSGGVGGEINVTFRYGAAEVDGSIKQAPGADTASRTPPSGQVLLVPEVMNADGSGSHFGSTDTSGSFTLKQVPPGRYKAYALEELNFGEVQNPEFRKALESKATDVQVKENDKLQIQLPLISSEELRQLLMSAGVQTE